jgi:peptidoglycan-N-acetylglucosamine deacetylase
MANRIRSRYWPAGAITHVETGDRIAALTFDDGPHPDYTPRLLEILWRHRAQATFFMVGDAASRHPHLVRQVAEAGHTIGNHAWDHPSFHAIPSRQRRDQLRACQRVLAPYGVHLFRPPYGHQNRLLPLEALWLQYDVVAWSLDSLDWRDACSESIARRLIDGIKPGSIVLLHDSIYGAAKAWGAHTRRDETLKAVDLCLSRLGDDLSFVTIPELLASGRPARRTQPWWGRRSASKPHQGRLTRGR